MRFGGCNACVYLLALLCGKANYCAYMVTLLFGIALFEFVVSKCADILKRLVELNNEIVFEVLMYATYIASSVTNDAIILGIDLDVRPFV